MKKLPQHAAVIFLSAVFAYPTTTLAQSAQPPAGPKATLVPAARDRFPGRTSLCLRDDSALRWQDAQWLGPGTGRFLDRQGRGPSQPWRWQRSPLHCQSVQELSGHIRHSARLRFARSSAMRPVFRLFSRTGAESLRTPFGAVQLQVPMGYTWDYRTGHNNAGNGEFTRFPHPKYDPKQWSRIELLVNADTGTVRMAVAQPVGGNAVEVVDFHVPEAGRTGPFALQMHNKGLFDEYANLAIEVNPAKDDLITIKAQ